MLQTPAVESSVSAWTLKKAVTTLAISPQSGSLARAGRMTYNVMILKAQRMNADPEGGYSAPLSEIIKGFGATTRDSTRIRAYMEQMCTMVVKWFPLANTDELQGTLTGMEPQVMDPTEDGRIFTLLSEVRFSRRGGEQWVTWYFPPTIRDMVIEPSRWAQLDIKDLASLSHYAGVALYEICARYKDVPGGFTKRAEPAWWVQVLRPDPDTKPREWRKFKNETLNPAIAEINQRTSLEVRVIEYKQGRSVVEVQFNVKRKPRDIQLSSVDLSLVEQAFEFGIKERDLDLMVDEFGEEKVGKALQSMTLRKQTQPQDPITHPRAYLMKTLRNGQGPLFDLAQTPADVGVLAPAISAAGNVAQQAEANTARIRRLCDNELSEMEPRELERLADIARGNMEASGILTPAVLKRFTAKQFRSPLIWDSIRTVHAEEKFGLNWKTSHVS